MTRKRTHRVVVLTGPQFDDVEHFEIVQYFANRGYYPDVVSDLRGEPSAQFHGNDPDKLGRQITVKRDVRQVNLDDYDGVVVVGGYCTAYLRVPDDPGSGEESASVQLVRAGMETAEMVVGIHCHSLWLLTGAQDLLRGRRVTTNHNVVWDALNAGADVQFTEDGTRTLDVCVDGLLVTGRERTSTHAFCDAVFTLLEREKR
ncbi:MAG: DJ-1/PfpI family protein [Ramlibacter sp.]|nr:DJ-1/PfpI family protein [Ramlibacter sp.]